MSNFDTEKIEEKIGYCFENKSLLKLAFTHSSYANENKAASNERLEFLGDSILGFCIAEYLFRKVGGNEGDLSVTRSKIVSESPLARHVDSLDIIGYLICGVGEERNNPDKSDKIKGDLFEAVIGAVYLDSGDISVCERFIIGHLSAEISAAVSGVSASGAAVIGVPESKMPRKLKINIPEKRFKAKHSYDADEPDTVLTAPRKPEKPRKDRKKEIREEKSAEKPKGGKEKQSAKKEPKEKKVKEKGKAQKQPEEKKNEQDKSAESRPADYKSALQNYLQNEKRPKPEYVVRDQSGSAHAPVFNVDVIIDGRVCGSGAGGRKKDAEQKAAEQAYDYLGLSKKR